MSIRKQSWNYSFQKNNWILQKRHKVDLESEIHLNNMQ